MKKIMLVVLIDKNLSWKTQINEVKLHLSKGCAVLSKIRHCSQNHINVSTLHLLNPM